MDSTSQNKDTLSGGSLEIEFWVLSASLLRKSFELNDHFIYICCPIYIIDGVVFLPAFSIINPTYTKEISTRVYPGQVDYVIRYQF